MTVLAEKNVKNSLVSHLEEVASLDKMREHSVIKYIREGFLEELAQKFSEKRTTPLFIAATGESASGKSTFTKAVASQIKAIEKLLNRSLLEFVSSDNYFNDISDKIKKYGSFDNFLAKEDYNPDAPTSFNLELFRKNILDLKNNKDVLIPEYKVNGSGISIPNAIRIKSSPIILIEGIASLYEDVRDLFDIKFYVEVDEKIRKKRYVFRAMEKRGQKEEDTLKQYEIVNASAQKYIVPQREYADVIINGDAGIENFSYLAREILSKTWLHM